MADLVYVTSPDKSVTLQMTPTAAASYISKGFTAGTSGATAGATAGTTSTSSTSTAPKPTTTTTAPAPAPSTTSSTSTSSTSVPKATLYNPTTGQRVAVVIGSTQEKSLFSQGYLLEGAKTPTTTTTTAPKPTTTTTATTTAPSTDGRTILPTTTSRSSLEQQGYTYISNPETLKTLQPSQIAQVGTMLFQKPATTATTAPKTATAAPVVSPLSKITPTVTNTYSVPFTQTLMQSGSDSNGVTWEAKRTSIENLVNSGNTFNDGDAKNFAYAIGVKDWQPFVGKTGEQILAGFASQVPTIEPPAEEPVVEPVAEEVPLDPFAELDIPVDTPPEEVDAAKEIIAGGEALTEEQAQQVAGATGFTDWASLVGQRGDQIIRIINGGRAALGNIPFYSGVAPATRAAVATKVSSGQPFSVADAEEFAYATGSPNASKYVGKTGAEAVAMVGQDLAQTTNNLLANGFKFVANTSTTTDGDVVRVGDNLYSKETSLNAMKVDTANGFGALPSLSIAGTTDGISDESIMGLSAPERQLEEMKGSLNQAVGGLSEFRQNIVPEILKAYDLKGLEDDVEFHQQKLDAVNDRVTAVDAEINTLNTYFDNMFNEIENKPVSLSMMQNMLGYAGRKQMIAINSKIGQKNSLLAQQAALKGDVDVASAMYSEAYKSAKTTADAMLEDRKYQIDKLENAIVRQGTLVDAQTNRMWQANLEVFKSQLTNEQKMNDAKIGLMTKYGVTGSTFDEVMANAAPYMEQERNLSLMKTQADYQKTMMDIQKMNKEMMSVGTTGLTQEQINTATALNQKFMTLQPVLDVADMRMAYSGILNNIADAIGDKNGDSLPDDGVKPNPYAGQVVMSNFLRMLNPNSNVKPGQTLTLEEMGSLSDELKNVGLKIWTGQNIGATEVKQLRDAATNMMDSSMKGIEGITNYYGSMAEQQGIPAAFVVSPITGDPLTTSTLNMSWGTLTPNGISDDSPYAGVVTPNVSATQPSATSTTGGTRTREQFETFVKGLQQMGASPQDISQITGVPVPSSLGTLSSKFESGGNPGAIGYDRTGGVSYGTYQLTQNNVKKFVEQTPLKKAFAGLQSGTAGFNKKWKEVSQADPEGFSALQHDYISKTHFEPQVKKVVATGFDLMNRSKALLDVVWSTAVQHGANTDVITKAIAKVGKKATDAALIRAIYNERWSGGKRFASSTESVRKAVYNRFFGKNGELNTALNMLGMA